MSRVGLVVIEATVVQELAVVMVMTVILDVALLEVDQRFGFAPVDVALGEADAEVSMVVDLDSHVDLLHQLVDVLCIDPIVGFLELLECICLAVVLLLREVFLDAFVDVDVAHERQSGRCHLNQAKDHGLVTCELDPDNRL